MGNHYPFKSNLVERHSSNFMLLGLHLSNSRICWFYIIAVHKQLSFTHKADFYIELNTLCNVEAKKRFEFLEAVSGMMDAHLRYFKQVCKIIIWYQLIWSAKCVKYWIFAASDSFLFFWQGYELLQQMEPFIHQVCHQQIFL